MINSTLTKRIPPPRIPLKFKVLLGAEAVGNVAFYSIIFEAVNKLSPIGYREYNKIFGIKTSN